MRWLLVFVQSVNEDGLVLDNTNGMTEQVANLFLYVEGRLIKSLGAIAHDVDGSDDQIATFLQAQVAADSLRAVRYPLPIASIKSWLGIDAQNGLSYEYFSYLHRTGKALLLFEVPLQAISAPEKPFVCFTSIVDGKPKCDVIAHADPLTCPIIDSNEFDGIVKRTDWLAAYMKSDGVDVHELLADDFTDAIKLLFAHKHYVSALKLIMSFVDTVAYLDLGDIPGNFEAWLSKYATLAPVGVTPSELWEFRNAILHTTSPLSRKVISGKVPPIGCHVDHESKSVRIDRNSGTKMFSFESLYDSLVEAIEMWVKSYSGNLGKQVEFIQRYDSVLSEGRLATFSSRMTDI